MDRSTRTLGRVSRRLGRDGSAAVRAGPSSRCGTFCRRAVYDGWIRSLSRRFHTTYIDWIESLVQYCSRCSPSKLPNQEKDRGIRTRAFRPHSADRVSKVRERILKVPVLRQFHCWRSATDSRGSHITLSRGLYQGSRPDVFGDKK